MQVASITHALDMIGQSSRTLEGLGRALSTSREGVAQHEVLGDLMGIVRRTGAAERALESTPLAAAHREALHAVTLVSGHAPDRRFAMSNALGHEPLEATVRHLDLKLREARNMVEYLGTPPSTPELPELFRVTRPRGM